MKSIGKTASVCPACLKVIPATIVEKDDRVFMEKTCPQHGSYSALISSDLDSYSFAKELYPNPQKPND
jgi:uncharacterized radical SAM superfamily Fe-S cluster-containing enzyme